MRDRAAESSALADKTVVLLAERSTSCCSNPVPVIDTIPTSESGAIAAGDVRAALWQPDAPTKSGSADKAAHAQVSKLDQRVPERLGRLWVVRRDPRAAPNERPRRGQASRRHADEGNGAAAEHEEGDRVLRSFQSLRSPLCIPGEGRFVRRRLIAPVAALSAR